jgi:hypothetical protein
MGAPAKLPRIRERLLFIAFGFSIAVVGIYGLPTLGLALYGPAFRSAFIDCRLSEVNASKLNKLTLNAALESRVRETEAIDELSCLDYRGLRNRLETFRVSDSELKSIETDLTTHASALLQ